MLLKEAIAVMRTCKKDNNRRFAIDCVSYDKKRKNNGRLIQLTKCHLVGSSHDKMEHGTLTIQSDLKDNPSTVHIRLIMKLNSEPVYV